jgi:hypothetical protein
MQLSCFFCLCTPGLRLSRKPRRHLNVSKDGVLHHVQRADQNIYDDVEATTVSPRKSMKYHCRSAALSFFRENATASDWDILRMILEIICNYVLDGCVFSFYSFYVAYMSCGEMGSSMIHETRIKTTMNMIKIEPSNDITTARHKQRNTQTGKQTGRAKSWL